MVRSCRWTVAALVAGCVAGTACGVTRVILGDNAAVASSSYSNREARYAVNGAGLVGNLHSNTADKVVWMSGTQTTTISGQWFRVDLGQVMPLSHLKLWNFNFWHATVATTNRGIREAEVYLSSLDTTPGTDFADASQWTRVIDQVTFERAPGLNTYAGEPEVSLAGFEGRWLALRVLSNFAGAADRTVGISELQVFVAERPVVLSAPPTAVEPTQVTLPGALSFDGGLPNAIFAHWGATDGGTVSSAWDHVVSLGELPMGAFSATVPVAADSEYVFRFRAVNSQALAWSAPGAFLTAPVSVEMPASVSEGTGALPVTFRRPASLTNTTVTLSFGISGDVLEGEDYLRPPATVIMPAGSAAVQTVVALVDDLIAETNETLTVGLGPSACVRTAAGTNSTVIVDDEGPLDTPLWGRQMKVTLPGYSGASTLTNFPVALRLHEGLSGFRYADFATPGGGDLRVTDAATGETQTYEIEVWNPAGTSVVWVCVARLSGTATALRLHWGNAAASLPGYATGGVTWHSGFGGVWHLNQPDAADSTVNRNHGVAYGGVSAAPGILGGSLWFSGSNFVQVADHASIGTNTAASLTLSTWFKADVTLQRTNDTYRLLEKGDDYFFIQGYGNAGGLVFLVKQGDTPFATGNGADVEPDAWHHVCGTYDGAALRLYVDGALSSTLALPGLIDDDRLPLRIGSDDSGKYFKGSLDELRVESAVRGADWIKACYDSQREGAAFCAFQPAVRLYRGTLLSIR